MALGKNPVTRLLEKMGIKDPATELSSEEKATLDNWRKILSEGEITVPAIKNFCDYHLSVIEGAFRDISKTDAEKARLTLLHSVYSGIRDLIQSPKSEREALEKYLTSLL